MIADCGGHEIIIRLIFGQSFTQLALPPPPSVLGFNRRKTSRTLGPQVRDNKFEDQLNTDPLKYADAWVARNRIVAAM